MTKSSPNSVPMTTSVSRPSPPSIRTGALTVYWMRSAPWPPLRFDERRRRVVRVDAHERADEERVVVVLAEEEQLGEVVVDVKLSSPLPPNIVVVSLMPFER